MAFRQAPRHELLLTSGTSTSPLVGWQLVLRLPCSARVQGGSKDSTDLDSLLLFTAVQKSIQAAEHGKVPYVACDDSQGYTHRYCEGHFRQSHDL